MKKNLTNKPAPALLDLIEAVEHGVQDIRAAVEVLPSGDRAQFTVMGRPAITVHYRGEGVFAPGCDGGYLTNVAGAAARVAQIVTAELIGDRLGVVRARRIAAALNRIIATRNLYWGSQRYVFAESSKGQVTVENLQTGARKVFTLAECGWVDGYGRPITEGDLQ